MDERFRSLLNWWARCADHAMDNDDSDERSAYLACIDDLKDTLLVIEADAVVSRARQRGGEPNHGAPTMAVEPTRPQGGL